MVRTIHLVQSKCPIYLYSFVTINFSAIREYSTASTSYAAYIIGGYYTKRVVAEFKDNQWRQLNNLNKGRYMHGSLSVGDQTIIIGGTAESGK